MDTPSNVVLVHGAWADGSCWSAVIERLQADGYHVMARQFPLTALADDVARLRQVLDLQNGPTIAAGRKRIGATTIEVPSGHLAMVSHPDEVTQLINTAAETRASTST